MCGVCDPEPQAPTPKPSFQVPKEKRAGSQDMVTEETPEAAVEETFAVRAPPRAVPGFIVVPCDLQGYLAHKKPPPPRTLQQDHA